MLAAKTWSDHRRINVVSIASRGGEAVRMELAVDLERTWPSRRRRFACVGGQVTVADVTIRLATPTDVDGLMALESRYYAGNLDPSQRAEGFISDLHSRQWFEHTIRDGGLHVAVIDDAVAGFAAVTEPPPRNTPGLSPFTMAMLQLAGELEFNGARIAAQRFGVRGPVCIGEQARGRGIYTAFNAVTAQAYRDRFDLGVLFVSTDNPRSLHTATTKLGATPLAVFEVDGKTYHFLAFTFHPDE